MIDADKVIRGLQDIKTYLASQAEEAEKVGNDLAKEGHIESQIDIIDAITLIKCGQPIKGKWTDKQVGFCGNCYARCSVCNQWNAGYTKETIGGNEYLFYPFCHYCGADMRGEHE